MILLLGASLSLAGSVACRRPVEEIVPYVTAPEDVVPGVPRYYATTMPFGRSAYGLIVESHEGRPTKVEGNPAHPSTGGASSVRIQASMLGLSDPDRSKSITQKGERKAWTDFAAAWQELAKTHAADGGAGLAILSGSFSSPTLARLSTELRARFPEAAMGHLRCRQRREPARGSARGDRAGRELMLRFDRASVILSLDADPLQSDPEMIRHARGFADGRRAGASGGTMNRLYAVEGVYSLTGAMADHRLRVGSRHVAAFVAALAARLGAPGAPAQAAEIPGVEPRWVDAVAKDLQANRGGACIVVGDRQPAGVHAAAVRAERRISATPARRSATSRRRTQRCRARARWRRSSPRCPRARSRRSSSSAEIQRSMPPPISNSRPRWRKCLTRSRSDRRPTRQRRARNGTSRRRTTSNRGEMRVPSAGRSASSSR